MRLELRICPAAGAWLKRQDEAVAHRRPRLMAGVWAPRPSLLSCTSHSSVAAEAETSAAPANAGVNRWFDRAPAGRPLRAPALFRRGGLLRRRSGTLAADR